jgi:hypothetical protein
LQQYLTQAIEWLLVAVLRVIGSRPQGYQIDEILLQLLDGDFQRYLNDVLKNSAAVPSRLMKALGATPAPNDDASHQARQRRRYRHSLSEPSICSTQPGSPAELTARSCVLLAVLYEKWRGTKSDPAYLTVIEHAGSQLIAWNVLQLLDRWFDATTTWEDALREMLSVLVIAQHDRVMYEKGRLESCWLHRDDDRIVQDQDYLPYFRTPRYRQAIEILCDLGAVKRDDETLVINATGRKLLARALEGIT